MNTPVNFEIAKSLKEKGFDEECRYYYDTEFKERTWHIEYEPFRNSEIETGYGKKKYPMISAPTIAEVVMWLYKKRGIWISVDPENDTDTWFFTISYNNSETIFGNYSTPTEAYEAAIEYALKELI